MEVLTRQTHHRDRAGPWLDDSASPVRLLRHQVGSGPVGPVVVQEEHQSEDASVVEVVVSPKVVTGSIPRDVSGSVLQPSPVGLTEATEDRVTVQRGQQPSKRVRIRGGFPE
ncbi:hypothetical protein M3677_16535 [Curtobacterium sp. P97]|nr:MULTISPECIES: hypothetical protein [unclassified Curtobacterium]MCM3523223.1 hypothetical protein [Curtobacterium sp. P97]MDB6426255.1 hypothetical protein [Curtobacterium sp. 20TX0008]